MSSTRPWLLSLATRQRGRVPTAPVVYDDARQIAVVIEGGRVVPAITSSRPLETKKADIEKGEDRKDRWWQS
jgi:putative ATP-grasp target RiPP